MTQMRSLSEHLKHSGPVLQNWFPQIYNHICWLEQIPQCFKHGIVIPVTLIMKIYRGVTLTSVIASVGDCTHTEDYSNPG